MLLGKGKTIKNFERAGTDLELINKTIQELSPKSFITIIERADIDRKKINSLFSTKMGKNFYFPNYSLSTLAILLADKNTDKFILSSYFNPQEKEHLGVADVRGYKSEDDLKEVIQNFLDVILDYFEKAE